MRSWENGANGAVHYYALDLPGNNVQGMFDATGAVTHRYSYAPFGEPISATGTVTNPLRFAAREIDAATGLYYVRAASTTPSLGRFLSEEGWSRHGRGTPPDGDSDTMKMTSRQLELLRAVIRSRAPQLLHFCDTLGTKPLTDDERESLRRVIAGELVAAGLDQDDEANAYGNELDDLIDRLGDL